MMINEILQWIAIVVVFLCVCFHTHPIYWVRRQMAYNLPDERLLELMVSDPRWVLVYHRQSVVRLLPTLAKSHMLVEGIRKEVEETLEKAEGPPDEQQLAPD